MMKNYRRKPTHLFLNNKKITNIDDSNTLRFRSHVEVIYLQNNSLTTVDSLTTMKNLTHVYLQWNHINCMTNLNDLPNLSHLYLGHNCITIVNGLLDMPNLKILHIEKQNSASEGLKFASNTIKSISPHLTELNISQNNINSLSEIKSLKNLILFDTSYNLLSNKHEILFILKTWKKLKTLKIEGNPVMKNFKYNCELITSSSSLEMLNEKLLPTSTRPYLRKLINMKEAKEKLRTTEKRIEFSSETQNYVQQLPRDLQEIVSQSMKLNKRK